MKEAPGRVSITPFVIELAKITREKVHEPAPIITTRFVLSFSIEVAMRAIG